MLEQIDVLLSDCLRDMHHFDERDIDATVYSVQTRLELSLELLGKYLTDQQ